MSQIVFSVSLGVNFLFIYLCKMSKTFFVSSLFFSKKWYTRKKQIPNNYVFYSLFLNCLNGKFFIKKLFESNR